MGLIFVTLFGSSAVVAVAAPNERAGERRLYDLRRRRRTSERENEEDERDLKVSHSATKVKVGFPQSGPIPVSV